MARGARTLTKKEKDKLQLVALIDRCNWRLTGTLVHPARRIDRSYLKSKVEKSVAPYSRIFNGRNTIVFDCNVWAEQILPGDEEIDNDEPTTD